MENLLKTIILGFSLKNKNKKFPSSCMQVTEEKNMH